MSDTEKASGKAGGAWTDKERLVYLIALLDNTGVKLDFKNSPRPNGRTEIACQRMVDRLKTSYKSELEALKAGGSFDNGTPATPKKRGPKPKQINTDADAPSAVDGTPKTPKRKAKASDVATDASPKKRGRGKKVDTEEQADEAAKDEDLEI